MPQLRVELEYGYGGEVNYQIIDNETDELVAIVFAGQETAERMIESLEIVEQLTNT